MKKRALSLIMAFMLCLSLMPTEVLAQGTTISTENGAEDREGETGTNRDSAEQTGTNRDSAEQTGTKRNNVDSVSDGNSGVSADSVLDTANVPVLLAENEADTDNVAEVTAGGTTTQYASLAEALAAVKDGGTITLLADVSENVTVEAGRTVTFDFNGHSWNAWDTNTITVLGNVTVTGNGVMQNSRLNDIFVGDGGQVHLKAGMTFSRVWAHDNASVTLDAGVIITNNIFSGGSDISGFFAGKALQRYDLDSEKPIEGSYVPINKNYDMNPTGCIIVIEHTKHIYESGTTGYCDVCGAACDHANMKSTDPSCPDCHAEYVASVVLTDVNGAAYPERFTVLQEALEYANSAQIAETKVIKAELTLLKEETVAAAAGAVCTFDNLTADMTVDIDLNGKTLTCGSRFLAIYGGKVSIHDGSIHCTNAESMSAIYVARANSLTPELTLTNVNITTTSDEYNETFSVHVYNGKLTIQGEGQYSVLEVYESDGVQLFGGSFEGIKMQAGDDFASLLAKGCIYEDADGNFMSGDALAKQADDTMNSKRGYRTNAVRVVKCKNHDFEASKCKKCGFVCTHKDGEESTLDDYGVCTVCGNVCPHEHVSEADGVTTCSDCKAQMVLKVTSGEDDTYYARAFDKYGMEETIKAVLNKAPDGSTVTMLADNLNAWGFVTGGKTITLDMNGRTLKELCLGGITVGDYGEIDENKLIVIGEGYSEKDPEDDNDQYYAFRVREKGTLDLSDTSLDCSLHRIYVDGGGTLISGELAEITIDTLEIASSTAEISLLTGNFGEIIIDPALSSLKVEAGSLLKENWGVAFRYTGGNGAYVLYNTVISTGSPLKDVRIDACRHERLDAENTCEYCGMHYIPAMLYDGTWDNMGRIMNWMGASFSPEDMQTAAGYAFDSLRSFSGTLKLFRDVELGDRVVDRGYDNAIDLNGHKVTDGTLTVAKSSEGNSTELTITDYSEGKNGEFANVKVSDGTSLIVDGVHVGTITAAALTAEITLKAGSSFEGYSLPEGMMLADWIEDGCFIYDTGADGNARIPVALTETGAKTAAGKFVVEKAAVKVTAGTKTGEIAYDSSVSVEFCPEVTITDTSAYENFGFIKVEWYRRTDSGCQPMGSGTIKDGSYAVNLIAPNYDGVKAGDTLNVFCAITAVDNTDAETPFWQTVITGYELKVIKGNSSVITAPAATADMVYKAGQTDKKWSLVTAGTAEGGMLVYSLSKDGTYTEAIPTAENAGSYTVWYKVRGDENHTDTELESVTAEIVKAEITIGGFDIQEKIYDGTADAEVFRVNFKNNDEWVDSELVLGTDYTVKAAFEDAKAGSDKKVKATVTLCDTEKTGNYVLLGNEAEDVWSIKKATAPAAATGTLYILNNRTAQYTFDLSDLLPELADGCSFGKVTISDVDVKWNKPAYSTKASVLTH